MRFRFPPVDEEFHKSLAHDPVGVHESNGPGNGLSERVLAVRGSNASSTSTSTTHKDLNHYHKEGVRRGPGPCVQTNKTLAHDCNINAGAEHTIIKG